jgi:hypothetical protein
MQENSLGSVITKGQSNKLLGKNNGQLSAAPAFLTGKYPEPFHHKRFHR